MDRPFRLGDRIIVNDIDGTVEDIGLRSVRIRTLERKLVTIPNSQLSDASIENVSAEPMRRVLAKLGLTYDTTPDKMNEAMSILKGMPKKIKEIDSNDCFVFFSDFGDFSLQITFIYFIKKEADIIQTISIVNSEVLRAFNEAGLNFAFPTQTIQIESQLPNE